jgi:hypothetical protein
MKMNFLSGVKPKSLLGRKLSNRYLSSDAFNSSGRLGRTKRRLGSSFSGRRSLFEIKYTVFRVGIAVVLLCLFIYAIPTFRYGIHRMLVHQFVPTTITHTLVGELASGEFYVAPKYLTTDKFIGKPGEGVSLVEGDVIVESYSTAPIGIVESVGPTVVIRLFSDAGFKNSFYIYEEVTKDLPPLVPAEDVETPDDTGSSTDDNDETQLAIATSARTKTANDGSLKPALFEGSGYGEIIAKLPPQSKDVKVGDTVYVQTVDGPKAVAEISQVSEDISSGSTFTIVRAQLLVSPQGIYRVKMITE